MTNISLMIVRAADQNDFEQCFSLVVSVAAEGSWIAREPPLDRAATERAFLEDLADPDAERFVAVDGGDVVGELGARKQRYGVVSIGMMVAASHRRRGVGTALLEAAVAWARSVGSHKLSLEVWPHNEAARRLYRRFGFVEEGTLRRHYPRRTGELWDAVIMGLPLDDPQ